MDITKLHKLIKRSCQNDFLFNYADIKYELLYEEFDEAFINIVISKTCEYHNFSNNDIRVILTNVVGKNNCWLSQSNRKFEFQDILSKLQRETLDSKFIRDIINSFYIYYKERY